MGVLKFSQKNTLIRQTKCEQKRNSVKTLGMTRIWGRTFFCVFRSWSSLTNLSIWTYPHTFQKFFAQHTDSHNNLYTNKQNWEQARTKSEWVFSMYIFISLPLNLAPFGHLNALQLSQMHLSPCCRQKTHGRQWSKLAFFSIHPPSEFLGPKLPANMPENLLCHPRPDCNTGLLGTQT